MITIYILFFTECFFIFYDFYLKISKKDLKTEIYYILNYYSIKDTHINYQHQLSIDCQYHARSCEKILAAVLAEEKNSHLLARL